ncbi:cupin domain-containing protein [Actinomadura sp. LOL_016]|uniref:cupin domain-containing protein n=1 Tax=unclassified Actinomadura TaxID=2626254 RepID=UPI003A813AD6
MTVTPIDLLASVVHLRPGGTIHADHWEIHPEAEEVVSCLIGKIRLYLRPEGPEQQEEEIRLAAGTAAIVARGRWHRIQLDTPSSIMAVTLPRGSRQEKRSETRPAPKAGER